MKDDYFLAGEVVEGFIELGNVARAMVLQGMKEYSKITFGEEVLALFGEEDGEGNLRISPNKEINILIGEDEKG